MDLPVRLLLCCGRRVTLGLVTGRHLGRGLQA